MKRTVTVLLSLLMIFSVIPFSVYAVQSQQEPQSAFGHEEQLGRKTADLSRLGNRSAQAALAANQSNYAAALAALVDGVAEHRSSVVISEYNIPVSKFENLFADVLYQNPQFFYLDTYAECMYYQGSSVLYSIEFRFLYDKDTANALKEKMDNALSAVLNTAGALQTDLEKILYIHDYIVLNCAYDMTLYSDPEAMSPDSFSILGCLMKGNAVCQGYGLANKYLLNLLGIAAEFLSSEEMNHGWTIVELDGAWYHVDPTWDDPAPDSLGNVLHKYFLKSDAVFVQNGHSGWSTDKTANSTVYDDYFWDTVNSAFVVLDGSFFYITDDKKLIKRDMVTGQMQVLPYMADTWQYWNKPFTYAANYAKLATANGLLYYNTSTKIYSIKPDGTDNKVEFYLPAGAQGYIYGIHFIDKKLHYSLKTKPSSADVLHSDTNIKECSPKTDVVPFSKGDINGDGYISVSDVLMVQKHIVKVLELTPQQFAAADVNEDSKISTRDVVQIQKKVAGMIGDFEVAA